MGDMLQVVARDGDAVLLADGEVGVLVTPTGHLTALVGSITSMGDFEPYDGPMPTGASTPEIRDEVQSLKRQLGLTP